MAKNIIVFQRKSFQNLENMERKRGEKTGIAFIRKSRYNDITLKRKEVTAMVWEGTSRIPTEHGEKEVRYFVTEPICPEDNKKAGYGIGISSGKTTYIAEGFCSGKDEAVHLAKKMQYGTVMPASFFDILEEYPVQKGM